MKSKVIFLLAISAIVTLSFTFSSGNKADIKKGEAAAAKKADSEPAGGFVSEDKF